MCTLMVASRAFADVALLVAANRDERLDRPAEPPKIWTDRPHKLIAPKDTKSQGTWLGLNQAGLFVAITNRFSASPPKPARRSRGLLVLDALDEPDVGSAAARVMACPPALHNRFHLLLADVERAHLVWSDGDQVRQEALDAGVHVLTERSLGAGSTARQALVQACLRPDPHGAAPEDDTLIDLMSRHADDPFDGTCVHAPAFGYGTRSSILLRLDEKRPVRLLHAEGPPCKARFQDLSGEAACVLGV